MVWANLWPEPIDLEAKAADFLTACTFRNKSWDYLVLDLIFEINPYRVSVAERERFCERHAKLELSGEVLEEARALDTAYERYSSVAVAPCALGVPEGFDVRLQMMEYDGLDPERCLLLHYMLEDGLSVDGAVECVYEALSFKTAFSREILEELKACGMVFEDA